MANANAQLTLDYFSASNQAANTVSAYCGPRAMQRKPLRIVAEPIRSSPLEVIPVFVGIAG